MVGTRCSLRRTGKNLCDAEYKNIVGPPLRCKDRRAYTIHMNFAQSIVDSGQKRSRQVALKRPGLCADFFFAKMAVCFWLESL